MVFMTENSQKFTHSIQLFESFLHVLFELIVTSFKYSVALWHFMDCVE